MKSEAVEIALRLAKEVFNERLVSVFTIGSLAHGGFAPLVSDLDLALILDDSISAADLQRVATISAETKKTNAPLADRLSIFWSSWKHLEKMVLPYGRFPAVDRLDFIEDRKLIYGVDCAAPLYHPTKKELVMEGATCALAKFFNPEHHQLLANPEKLIAGGARLVTKTVLFPVRFVYTGATGKIGTNEAAVAHWIQHYSDHPTKPLVQAAFDWRAAYDEAEAIRLLPKNLSLIYQEFIRKYIEYSLQYECGDVVLKLKGWGQILEGKEKEA
jgi:predicted nucleotidyltransferase